MDQSPTPDQVSPLTSPTANTGMTFYEAIKKLVEGERITRLDWNNKDDFCLLNNTRVSLHKSGEAPTVFHDWILNDGDLAGTDWVVLDKQEPTPNQVEVPVAVEEKVIL